MYDFDFVKPLTLADAMAALTADGAQALAGGQTLLPVMKQRLAAPTRLVSLTAIPELRGASLGDDGLSLGATMTHAAVAAAAGAYPALAQLAGSIGDPAVRNRGTIGGSLANNDPAACYPAAVLASGATIVTTTRRIDADSYFQGLFTTALEPGEIITRVIFPLPDRAAYVKFRQPASHYPMCGVFVARFGDAVRVGVTGAGQEGVFRWTEAEAALNADFRPEAVAGLRVDPAGMLGDLHGSAEYRANLVQVLTSRAVAGA